MLGSYPIGGAAIGADAGLLITGPVVNGPVMHGGLTVLRAGYTWITAEWGDATPGDAAIRGYEISVNGGPYQETGIVNTYRLTWLQPGRTHQVSVRAHDDNGYYSQPLTGMLTTLAFPTAVKKPVLINGRVPRLAPGPTVIIALFPRNL